VPDSSQPLNTPVINGTCTTCHDSPNVGNHSLPVPLDIGTSHALQYEQDPNIRAALAQLSMPDLPVFLAARAPYFHNGAGASLNEVVGFYNVRFQMGLTQQEQADLVAFLKSL
jgi:cytochrome c peroxidase